MAVEHKANSGVEEFFADAKAVWMDTLPVAPEFNAREELRMGQLVARLSDSGLLARLIEGPDAFADIAEFMPEPWAMLQQRFGAKRGRAWIRQVATYLDWYCSTPSRLSWFHAMPHEVLRWLLLGANVVLLCLAGAVLMRWASSPYPADFVVLVPFICMLAGPFTILGLRMLTRRRQVNIHAFWRYVYETLKWQDELSREAATTSELQPADRAHSNSQR
jgi:hypothetical protein